MLKLVCRSDACHRRPNLKAFKRAHSKLLVLEERKREGFKKNVTRATEIISEDIKDLEIIVKDLLEDGDDSMEDVTDDSYFVDADVL